MLRHLCGFLVLGALLFMGKRTLQEHMPERPSLLVPVAASASPREVERAIDQAVLLELALRSQSALTDPVVREQLLRAMRLQGHQQEHEQDQALLKRALALGVHRVDPLVRQRLIFQAQQVLRASLHVPEPTEVELQRYLAARAARYREPARVSFNQIFVSRSRHPSSFDADIRALAARLESTELEPSRAVELTDPTLLPFELHQLSVREIDARFGPGVGESVSASPQGRWQGPVASSYGMHFFFVTSRVSGRLPRLDEQRKRVHADFIHDALGTALNAALFELRQGYRVVVQRDGT